jgi:hypothetical protein
MLFIAKVALIVGKIIKVTFAVFLLIFVLTIFALVFSGNSTIEEYNIEAVIFSLCIINIFKLPSWFKQALSTELFVKNN